MLQLQDCSLIFDLVIFLSQRLYGFHEAIVKLGRYEDAMWRLEAELKSFNQVLTDLQDQVARSDALRESALLEASALREQQTAHALEITQLKHKLKEADSATRAAKEAVR